MKDDELSATPPPFRKPSQREQAIDILRGLALITITINHLTGFVFRAGMKGTAFPTLSHWGFSSAAEIFFLVSGYLVGAVYLRADRDRPLREFAVKMLSRARLLYLYNAALFLLLLPVCWLSPRLAKLSLFSHFIEGGAPAWVSFALLYLQPYCLEILATYMVLMIAAPLFAWALIRWPLPTVLMSFALYICAYNLWWLKVPGGTPEGDWRWNFSPASWQFLFFAAMAAGRYRLLDLLKAAFQADRRWFVAAVALFGALTLLFIAQTALKPVGLDFWIWGQSKVRVGPIRILHALSVCWFVLGALWVWPKVQQHWLSRHAAAIGSCSLQSFVASIFISYVAGMIWVEFVPSYKGYIALCLASVVALGAFVQVRRLWQERPTFALATQAA